MTRATARRRVAHDSLSPVHVARFAERFTGMRRGELLALRREHVDLDQGTVSATQSLTKHEGVLMVKDIQTGSRGRRVLPSAPLLHALLGAYVERSLDLGRYSSPKVPPRRVGATLGPRSVLVCRPHSQVHRRGTPQIFGGPDEGFEGRDDFDIFSQPKSCNPRAVICSVVCAIIWLRTPTSTRATPWRLSNACPRRWGATVVMASRAILGPFGDQMSRKPL